MGYNAVEVFFTLYAKKHLGLPEADGARLLGQSSFIFVLMALPSGYIGARLGRRKTIMTGLVFMMATLIAIASFSVATLVQPITRLPVLGVVPVIGLLLMVAGLAWALININSLPMVVDMTDAAHLGTYTGLYYMFSTLAAIAGPNINGWIIQSPLRIQLRCHNGCRPAVYADRTYYDERCPGRRSSGRFDPDWCLASTYLHDPLRRRLSARRRQTRRPTDAGGWIRYLRAHLLGILKGTYPALWAVHRLDKDTSGVIAFARTAAAHRELNTQFEQRQVSKCYLALVDGQPEWTDKTVRLSLRANGDRRHRTVVDHQKGTCCHRASGSRAFC